MLPNSLSLTNSRFTLTRIRDAARDLGWKIGAASLVVLFTATSASAAGSGMPWEAPLERILESVQGPVAKIVAVLIITVTGLSLAFGDTSGGFRKLVQVVFGLSIAFAATSFFLSFFSFGGGVLI
jgi:type IV secretion system protein VirB2